MQPSVPSASTLSGVYQGFTLDQSSYSAIQVLPKSRAQAVQMAISLLAVSVTASPDVESTTLTSNLSSEQAWLLGELTRFWKVVVLDGMHFGSSHASVTLVVLFLDSLRSLCGLLDPISPRNATFTRFTLLLSEAISALINSPILPLPSPIEISLCLNIITLASLSQRNQCFHQCLTDGILPAITEKGKIRFDSFGQDLQVCHHYSSAAFYAMAKHNV